LPFRFGTYFINKFEVHLKFILFSGDDDNKKLPLAGKLILTI